MKKNLVIILAGGNGRRANKEIPKQFIKIKNKTILQHTIEKFETHPKIDHIFLVIHKDFINQAEEIVYNNGLKKVNHILIGGQSRQESSYIGISTANPQEYQNVLIHDAARPMVTHIIIDNLLAKLRTYPAINLAISSADSIIQVDEHNMIKDVPNRNFFKQVQTPQAFKLELIQKAHKLAKEMGLTNATDDCSLIQKLKLAEIYVVDGSPQNIKITYPIDIYLTEKMINTHK